MSSRPAPALEALGLTRRFGEKVAVDRLDLLVRRGEVLGLMGPNGSGKSTILRMCGGLLGPSAGAALVFGRDPRQSRSLIGYVAQETEIHPHLTGVEFLDLMARLHTFPRGGHRQARIDRACVLAEFGDELSTLMGQASHGTRRRIAIAAQLIHEPELLLLDEPTGGLDPQATRWVKHLVRQHADRGAAVVISTHVAEIAEAVCDRLAMIERGRLVAEGSPESLRGLLDA